MSVFMYVYICAYTVLVYMFSLIQVGTYTHKVDLYKHIPICIDLANMGYMHDSQLDPAATG